MTDKVVPINGPGALDSRSVALGRVKQAVIELVECCGLEKHLSHEEQRQWWDADARVSFNILLDVHALQSAAVLLETDEQIRSVLEFRPSTKH
jgi:hypothetical protein